MKLRVMSFNLRYENERDGEFAWGRRRHAAAAVIRRHLPDVLCTQEGLTGMLEFLDDALDGAYERFGRGRNADGSGEFTAVYVRRDSFEVSSAGQFWFSPEPDVPGSVGWGASLPRICTWCRLRRTQETDTLVVFNVHLDNRSSLARREGIALLKRRMIEVCRTEHYSIPAIVCGDFNAYPSSPEISYLCEENPLPLIGCHDLTHGTFHGFRGEPDTAPIDYVLATPDIVVNRRDVDTQQYESIWPSDHFPVIAEIELRSERR